MFKIVNKKLWNDIVRITEFEVMEKQATIESYNKIINDGIPNDGTGQPSMAYTISIDRYKSRIPGLEYELEQKRQLLKRLKGD